MQSCLPHDLSELVCVCSCIANLAANLALVYQWESLLEGVRVDWCLNVLQCSIQAEFW